jgi:hypothetical protein
MICAQDDVESLLRPERRARLPLRRQLQLYLDPFLLFKDVTRGNARQRELALSYNRGLRWILPSYLRRWIFIACALFLAIAPTDALASQHEFFLVPATAVAVAFSVAFTVVVVIAAAWLLTFSGEL